MATLRAMRDIYFELCMRGRFVSLVCEYENAENTPCLGLRRKTTDSRF